MFQNIINKTCFILIILIISTVVYSQNNKKYESENFNDFTRWEKNVDFYNIHLKKIRYRIRKMDTIFVEGVLKQPTIINGYSFHKKVKFTKHGELLRGVLNKEYLIIGYSCHEEIFFTKNGELSGFTLSRDDTIVGHVFKKNTQAHFNEKRIRLYCPNNPVIQGYECNGTNYKLVFFVGYQTVNLYNSGKLMYFPPKHKIEIDGVKIKPSGVRGQIHLYENGSLKECTSSKEQIIQGKLVEKNFTLKFDESGNLTYLQKEKIFGN